MLPALDSPEKNDRMRRAVHALREIFGTQMIEGQGFIAFSRNASFLKDDNFRKAANNVLGIDDIGRLWALHTMHWAVLSALNLPGGIVSIGTKGKTLEFLIRASPNAFEKRPLRIFVDSIPTETYRTLLMGMENLRDASVHPTLDSQGLGEIAPDRIAVLIISAPEASAEMAAVEAMMPRLMDGAMIVIEDYTAIAFETRRKALDGIFARLGLPIFELPTGQGLAMWRAK